MRSGRCAHTRANKSAAVCAGVWSFSGICGTCQWLDRQIGWGNIRDKVTFGQFQAAHALLGMPLFSALGREWFSEPLLAVMNHYNSCFKLGLTAREKSDLVQFVKST